MYNDTNSICSVKVRRKEWSGTDAHSGTPEGDDFTLPSPGAKLKIPRRMRPITVPRNKPGHG
jgi:hypothetical protein